MKRNFVATPHRTPYPAKKTGYAGSAQVFDATAFAGGLRGNMGADHVFPETVVCPIYSDGKHRA
jgi:hypothetical protein